MTTDDRTDTPKPIRVRPVDGRLVRDETSHLPITEEQDVADTRLIRRRIADGDLELVGGDRDDDAAAAREADPRTRVADDLRPDPWGLTPEDANLTDEERAALRAAHTRGER